MTYSQVRILRKRMGFFSALSPSNSNVTLENLLTDVYSPRPRRQPPRQPQRPARSLPIRVSYRRNSCRRFSVSTRTQGPQVAYSTLLAEIPHAEFSHAPSKFSTLSYLVEKHDLPAERYLASLASQYPPAILGSGVALSRSYEENKWVSSNHERF